MKKTNHFLMLVSIQLLTLPAPAQERCSGICTGCTEPVMVAVTKPFTRPPVRMKQVAMIRPVTEMVVVDGLEGKKTVELRYYRLPIEQIFTTLQLRQTTPFHKNDELTGMVLSGNGDDTHVGIGGSSRSDCGLYVADDLRIDGAYYAGTEKGDTIGLDPGLEIITAIGIDGASNVYYRSRNHSVHGGIVTTIGDESDWTAAEPRPE